MEFFTILCIALFFSTCTATSASPKLFREYIGAESDSIKLTDVPINPGVEFHYILAFAVDYTTNGNSPSNGKFNVFWETGHINPGTISAIKSSCKNVKFAVSLGGSSVGSGNAYFAPDSIDSWVNNAVPSPTAIIKTYHIDGIDMDYENFKSDSNTFVECIGRLITALKKTGTISFSSIAPYEDYGCIQKNYMALWRKYGHVIDYVNFQFYAYNKGISVSKFIGFFNKQESNYRGGRILASFVTDGSDGGLTPGDGFFDACNELKRQGKLGGILRNMEGFNMRNNHRLYY